MMNLDTTRVFKTHWWKKLIIAVTFLAFQVGLLWTIVGDSPVFTLLDLLVELPILAFFFWIFLRANETIVITSDGVVIANLLTEKKFPLSSIRYAEQAFQFYLNSLGGSSVLRVEMEKATVNVGTFLTNNQINEAAALIFEHVKMSYPEHVVSRQQHEVEKFWSK